MSQKTAKNHKQTKQPKFSVGDFVKSKTNKQDIVKITKIYYDEDYFYDLTQITDWGGWEVGHQFGKWECAALDEEYVFLSLEEKVALL